MNPRTALVYLLAFMLPALAGGWLAHRHLDPFPQTYRATTVFERNDPVPEPEPELPDTAPFRYREVEIELKAATRIQAVLAPLGIFEGMNSKLRRERTVDKIRDSLTIRPGPAPGGGVRVEMELLHAGESPAQVGEMLRRIRDGYVYENSQGRIDAAQKLLKGAQERLGAARTRHARTIEALRAFEARNEEVLLPDEDPRSVRRRLAALEEDLERAAREGAKPAPEPEREARRLRDLLQVLPFTRQEAERLRSETAVQEEVAAAAAADAARLRQEIESLRRGSEGLFRILQDVEVPREPDALGRLLPRLLSVVAGILTGLVAVLLLLVAGLLRRD